MSKAMKGKGVIKKISNMLPQHSLITIYKVFVRPHLDYGDIFMMNQIRKVSVRKLKLFNTMLLLPLQVLL